MSAVSPSYPISAPVEFTVTSGGDGLLCNAEGFSTGDTPTENIIVDFVATNPSDLLFRQSAGTANTLERLAVGAVGDVLTVEGSAAVAQGQTVTTVADVADSLDGTYFLLNTPSTGYYVWFSTGAGAPDPGLTPGSDLFISSRISSWPYWSYGDNCYWRHCYRRCHGCCCNYRRS